MRSLLVIFNVYLSLMPNYVISKHISIVLMHLLDPVYMTTFSKFGGISRLCCSRVTSTSLCNGMSLRYPSQLSSRYRINAMLETTEVSNVIDT